MEAQLCQLSFYSRSDDVAAQECPHQASFFDTEPQATLNCSAVRAMETSVESCIAFIDTSRPESPRGLMSALQDNIKSPLMGFFSSPDMEQPAPTPYRLLDQAHTGQLRSTSHLNWIPQSESYECDCINADLWRSQSLDAQPWETASCVGHSSRHITSGDIQASNGAILAHPYYQIKTEYSAPEVLPVNFVPAAPLDDNCAPDEGKEYDWNEELSDHSQPEGSSSKHKSRIRSLCFDENSSPVGFESIQQTETRHYLCNVAGCKQPFLRPEHLRRHAQTKHSENKPYRCKITGCLGKFSRSDNMRSHYWTHLDRGGRKGKNKKFTLEELEKVLGHEDNNLLSRLKQLQQDFESKKNPKKHRTKRSARVKRSRR